MQNTFNCYFKVSKLKEPKCVFSLPVVKNHTHKLYHLLKFFLGLKIKLLTLYISVASGNVYIRKIKTLLPASPAF